MRYCLRRKLSANSGDGDMADQDCGRLELARAKMVAHDKEIAARGPVSGTDHAGPFASER
jgi:hypothetical protein